MININMNLFWGTWSAALIYITIIPYFTMLDRMGIFAISFIMVCMMLEVKELYQSNNQNRGRSHTL